MRFELKRVPINFKWKLNRAWKGYILPYRTIECEYCDGTGMSPEYKELERKWFNWNNTERNALRLNLNQDDVDVLWNEGRLRGDFKEKPTYQEVNEWEKNSPFGHDMINRMIIFKNRINKKSDNIKSKLEENNNPCYCKYCNGEGYYYENDKIKELADNWEQYEPPIGNGYQLWEGVSEGSPITPVFETKEELAEYCSKHIHYFAYDFASKEEWIKMINRDNFSVIMSNGKDNIIIG